LTQLLEGRTTQWRLPAAAADLFYLHVFRFPVGIDPNLGVHMSKIVLSLLFILSAQTAFANLSSPPEFSGEYAFHGQTKTMAVVHLERVYTLFQDGQNRLAELIGQQYTCEPVGSNFSSCHKVRNDLEVPTSVKERLTKPYQGRLQLQFGDVTGETRISQLRRITMGLDNQPKSES